METFSEIVTPRDNGFTITGTCPNAQEHTMTTAPLHTNQQVNCSNGDVEIHSKDFEDSKTDDEVDISSFCGTFYSDKDHLLKTTQEYQTLNKFEYPESDTRGRQYLLLALERLSYIALENQRIRNYKLGRPLDLYILFNEPVPSLAKNQIQDWPKSPNQVQFELPTLNREVKFSRQFINQNQTTLDSDWLPNHGIRNSFCTSETGRSGHFTYITRGFRNCSYKRARGSKSRYPCFISVQDILGARALEGSQTWIKATSALEKDRVYLESVNVWHLINLRPNTNSLYCFRQRSQSEMGLQKYSSVPTSRSHLSVHKLYSDLSNQNLRLGNEIESIEDDCKIFNFIDDEPTATPVIQEVEERPSIIDFRVFITGNSSDYYSNVIKLSPSLSQHQSLYNDDDLYEFDQPGCTSRTVFNDKRSVSFSPETVFIERDMDSPFWRDFAERRRRRRIMRQQRIMGNLRNRMSLYDLLKLHFRFHKKNDNPTEKISKPSIEDEDWNLTSVEKDCVSRSSSKRTSQPEANSKCLCIKKFFSCSWCSRGTGND